MSDIPLEIYHKLRNKFSFYTDEMEYYYSRDGVDGEWDSCHTQYETKRNLCMYGSDDRVISTVTISVTDCFFDTVIRLFVDHTYQNREKMNAYRLKKLEQVSKRDIKDFTHTLIRSMLIGQPVRDEIESDKEKLIADAVIELVWEWVKVQNGKVGYTGEVDQKPKPVSKPYLIIGADICVKPKVEKIPNTEEPRKDYGPNTPMFSREQAQAFLITCAALDDGKEPPVPVERNALGLFLAIGLGSFLFGVVIMAILLR